MRFGVFSNQQRHRTDVVGSWEEDLLEIQLADELGLDEAWVSQHSASPYLLDGLANPDLMIAKAAGVTNQIKLGPAVRAIAMYNPLDLAIDVTINDHLSGGRYMLGVGRSNPGPPLLQRGVQCDDTVGRFMECLAVMRRLFAEDEPFDIDGVHYQGVNLRVLPKPVQSDLPIHLATNTPSQIEWAGREGFGFLLSQFARPASMKTFIEHFDAGSRAAGLGAAHHRVTATRGIFIADSDAQAHDQLLADYEAHIKFNAQYFAPVFNEWLPPGGLSELTADYLFDEGLAFVGSPSTVADKIRDLYETTGGFGSFTFVTGKDWGTWAQRQKSMNLFAEEVMPKLADL
jgi:alkanesulfonate monooxygenase SsuD/methylene tetrahydromethanopterin reductase-like flavin-dependent oxidoreductase (luciferase family)